MKKKSSYSTIIKKYIRVCNNGFMFRKEVDYVLPKGSELNIEVGFGVQEAIVSKVIQYSDNTLVMILKTTFFISSKRVVNFKENGWEPC